MQKPNMTNKFLYCLLVFLLILVACREDDGPEPPSSSINKIMPLGASRVEGDRPEFESYRYELWKQLIDGGWTFDYIGTRMDEASYPDHANATFDVDHEGRGGWTSGEILEGIDNWLSQTGAPDIVLFSSPGGNDALQNLSYDEAVANINGVIDAIQAKNPGVTIIIEQMAPARSDAMTPELQRYFERMQQEVVDIATAQSTDSSSVIAVDMFTGINDTHFADDVHYSASGAKLIADRYYNVLTTVLEQ
jgi:lysophospholipase L1-like esterase